MKSRRNFLIRISFIIFFLFATNYCLLNFKSSTAASFNTKDKSASSSTKSSLPAKSIEKNVKKLSSPSTDQQPSKKIPNSLIIPKADTQSPEENPAYYPAAPKILPNNKAKTAVDESGNSDSALADLKSDIITHPSNEANNTVEDSVSIPLLTNDTLPLADAAVSLTNDTLPLTNVTASLKESSELPSSFNASIGDSKSSSDNLKETTEAVISLPKQKSSSDNLKETTEAVISLPPQPLPKQSFASEKPKSGLEGIVLKATEKSDAVKKENAIFVEKLLNEIEPAASNESPSTPEIPFDRLEKDEWNINSEESPDIYSPSGFPDELEKE
jgi:hypothetical protein